MHLRRFLSGGIAALWAACMAGPAVPAPSRQPQLAEASRLIVARTNDLRRERQLGAVQPNAALGRAAQQFAGYMAGSDRYGHEADGRAPAQRAQALGYDYCLVTENIAFQYSSAGFATGELAQRFVEGWINSPGHRENMLDRQATDTGVAVAQSPRSGRYYAVQMFGRPRSLHIVFSLANRSGTALRYEFGGETITLTPRVTQTHEVCLAQPLKIERPGRREPLQLQPAHGERYVIVRSGGRLRVTKTAPSR